MRIGEFSGLQWHDVDFENKVVNIRRSLQTAYLNGRKVEELVPPKTTNSYRAIPFFGETEQCFKAWMDKQSSYKTKLGGRWRCNPEFGDLVFTTTMGSPVTRYVIVHDIKKVLGNLDAKDRFLAAKEGRMPREFKRVHPHAFRNPNFNKIQTFCWSSA